jgi:hypothetical protein
MWPFRRKARLDPEVAKVFNKLHRFLAEEPGAKRIAEVRASALDEADAQDLRLLLGSLKKPVEIRCGRATVIGQSAESQTFPARCTLTGRSIPRG